LSRNNEIYIKLNQNNITNYTEVAEILGNFFQENSSDKIYEEKLIYEIKIPNESRQIESTIDPKNQNQINLKVQITMEEMDQTLCKCYSKSPGPEKTHT
jgi:hypothetical protein